MEGVEIIQFNNLLEAEREKIWDELEYVEEDDDEFFQNFDKHFKEDFEETERFEDCEVEEDE